MEEMGKPARTSWDFEKDARIKAAQETRQDKTEWEERLKVPETMTPLYMPADEWHEMERAAAKGLLPGPKLSPERRMLYFTLMGLYAAQKCGVLPLPIARAEKRMAIEAFNSQMRRDTLFSGTGEFYRKVEAACTAYAKRASFDNAEAMYRAVYGALPKKGERNGPFISEEREST